MWLVTPKVRDLGNNIRHRWLCERQASVLQAQSPPRLVLLSSCALSAQNKFRSLIRDVIHFWFHVISPILSISFSCDHTARSSIKLSWISMAATPTLFLPAVVQPLRLAALVSSLTHFLSSPMMMTVISENPEKMTQNVALFWGGDVHCTLMCRRCKQLNCYDVYLLYCKACLACQPASQHQHFPRCSELPVRTASCMAN